MTPRRVRAAILVTGAVTAGTAMLTRRGSTHSLKQTGTDDLVLLITYLNK